MCSHLNNWNKLIILLKENESKEVKEDKQY